MNVHRTLLHLDRVNVHRTLLQLDASTAAAVAQDLVTKVARSSLTPLPHQKTTQPLSIPSYLSWSRYVFAGRDLDFSGDSEEEHTTDNVRSARKKTPTFDYTRRNVDSQLQQRAPPPGPPPQP